MTNKDSQPTTSQSVKSDQISDIPKPEVQSNRTSPSESPSTSKLVLIMGSIYITMFLIALVSQSPYACSVAAF